MKKGDHVWVVDDVAHLNGSEEQSVFELRILEGTYLYERENNMYVCVSIIEDGSQDDWMCSLDQVFDHKPSDNEIRKILLENLDRNICNSKEIIKDEQEDLKFLKRIRWEVKSRKTFEPGII